MAFQTELNNANSVVEWFSSNAENPYFSVWLGSNISFQFCQDDFELAKQKLQENLEAAEQNKNYNKYTLKIHPELNKDGYIDNKTPVISSITFKCYDKATDTTLQPLERYQPTPAMVEILNKLNGLEQRFAAQEVEEEEEEEINEPPKTIGEVVAAYLADPMIKNLLVNLGMKLLNGNKPVTALAGVPTEQEEKIAYAIEVLKQADPTLGDDLLKLAAIAQQDPQQFNFLLSMLRK